MNLGSQRVNLPRLMRLFQSRNGHLDGLILKESNPKLTGILFETCPWKVIKTAQDLSKWKPKKSKIT